MAGARALAGVRGASSRSTPACPTGFRESGALVVAADRDDAEELRRLHELQRVARPDTEWLSPSRCRRLEPGALSAGGRRHAGAAGDAQADPRATLRALAAAVRGGRDGAEVQAIERDGERVTGVRTAAGMIAAGAWWWPPGAWSGGAGRRPAPPVRPVKGQILELRARGRVRRAARRGSCARRAATWSGRGDGRVVLGATVEEQGFDTTVTAGGVHPAARGGLGGAARRSASSSWCGVARACGPGTPDNLPVVGRGDREGLVWATGHWRNGVLLAPLTGEAVAEMLAGGAAPPSWSGIGPERFVPAGAARVTR